MLQQPVSKSVPPEVCFRWRLFLIQGAVASVLSPSAWIHLEKVQSQLLKKGNNERMLLTADRCPACVAEMGCSCDAKL